jgi:hypothetical protein
MMFGMSRVSSNVAGGARDLEEFNLYEFGKNFKLKPEDIPYVLKNIFIRLLIDFFMHPKAITNSDIMVRILNNMSMKVPYDNNNTSSPYYLGPDDDDSFFKYSLSEKKDFIQEIQQLGQQMVRGALRCAHPAKFAWYNKSFIAWIPYNILTADFNKEGLVKFSTDFVQKLLENCIV